MPTDPGSLLFILLGFALTFLVARVLGVLGLVSIGFLAFMLFTSNPFDRALPAPADGRDLNPLLQDVGMIVHPPLLYMGYVGFSVEFAFAVAALLGGRLDASWARWARPWTLVAWTFLTLGIFLGSFWAYYELGWGGWWFWDAVENASFMPWLVGTALIHSQAVTEKRGSFRAWTLLLAIFAFSLSLLGTFLVRSGVLTSVHAFASDPRRGLFILAFLGTVVGGSLLIYALRAPKVAGGEPFAAASRETTLLVNNLLLTVSAAMVLLGTLWPLVSEALDIGRTSVGPPYFGFLFTLLMIPVVVLLPFGPYLRWGRSDMPVLKKLLWRAGLATVACAIVAGLLTNGESKAIAGTAAAVWCIVGTLLYVAKRWREMPAGRRYPAEMAGMLGTDTSMDMAGFAWTRWDYPDPQTRSFTITFAAVPFWFIAMLAGIAPARWYIRRRRASFQHGMCRECGCDLRATPQRCPECGCAVAADDAIQERADVEPIA